METKRLTKRKCPIECGFSQVKAINENTLIGINEEMLSVRKY